MRAQVWRDLDFVLGRDWKHETGATLKVRITCVDSGGHHTEQVYRYTGARRRRAVFATKGMSEPGASPIGNPSLVSGKRVRLFPLGTTALKDSLYARLRIDTQGPRYVHFPMVEEEYFRQLTAEKVIVRYSRGRPVRQYEKVYERNEALDLYVLAYAGLLILGSVKDQLGKMVAALAAAQTPAPETPIPPTTMAAEKLKKMRRTPKRRNWINDY